MDHEKEREEDDDDDVEEETEEDVNVEPIEISAVTKYLREGEEVAFVARGVKAKITTMNIPGRMSPEVVRIPMLVVTRYNHGEGAARALMLDKKYRPLDYKLAFSGGSTVVERSHESTGIQVMVISPKWLFDSMSEKEEAETASKEKSTKEQFHDGIRQLKKYGYGFRHLDLATDLLRSPNYWLELNKVELKGSKLYIDATGQSLPLKAKKGFASAEDVSLSMGENDMRGFITNKALKTNEFRIRFKSRDNTRLYELFAKGLSEAQKL